MLDKKLSAFFFVLLFSLSALGCSKKVIQPVLRYGDSASKSDECVVILHGLARSAKSMKRLQIAITEAGYRTLNIDYPSRHYNHNDLVHRFIAPKIQQHCPPNDYRVHFVGHSMGGIMAMKYIQSKPLLSYGKVVTIGSPHQGSELVDKLGWLPLFKWINGPAGYELATVDMGGEETKSHTTNKVRVMAIAGTRSLNPFYSLLIPGVDDGKVSVTSASLPTAEQVVHVPYSHTFIMNKAEVAQAVVDFIAKP